VLPGGCPGESNREEAILVPPREGACPWATAELDALAAVLPDAAADAYPEPRHCRGEDAGKWADPVPDVQAPDAPSLPPERLKQQVPAALCTPDEVQCGERSCAVTAFAGAVAQLAPRVSLPREQAAVAGRPAEALQKPEPQLGPQESLLLLDGRAAPARASQGV